MTGSAGDRPRAAAPQILLLSELFPPFVGGSAVLFEGIYSRLEHRRVTVLTDSARSAAEDTERGRLTIERRAIASDYWGLRKPRAFAHHWRVGSFIRQLADRRRTLVHCGRSLPEGLAAALSRLRGGPQYACWAHGEDLTLQMTVSREMRMLTRWIVRGSVGIFCNSEHTAGLAQEVGVRSDRIHIIYPGVDVERFRPRSGAAQRQRLAPGADPLILSIGRLERRKGFDLTVRAVARLRQRFPSLRYLVVGDGPDRDYLRALVRECGVGDQVTFTGKVAEEELPGLYAACDLFVHPNRIEGVDVEGFGIVFLEAAACGKPVIGGATGGVPEAVADGETGKLVSGTDEEELAAAISVLVESPAERARMGESGRRRVESRFTWSRAARQMEEVQSLLEERIALP